MNNIERDIINEDGTISTIVISSNDNYKLNLSKTYKLANYKSKKENKIKSLFKNSILGTEIGVKAEGFTSIAILATIIAISTLFTMYIFWRL